MHPDPLGTPRAVTNAAGTVVWRNSPVSEPFGLLPPEQDPDNDGTPFVMNLRFPGQYFDRETNLAYNWHRSYDAQVGAYTTSDPIGLAGGQWSTYGYVNGNPISYTDPEGLTITKPWAEYLGGLLGKAGKEGSKNIMKLLGAPETAGIDAATQLCSIYKQGAQPKLGILDACSDQCSARVQSLPQGFALGSSGWFAECLSSCQAHFQKCNKADQQSCVVSP